MPVTLILKEDIDCLGKAGELVSVRPGYARNYLIPNHMAVVATHQNLLWLKEYRHDLEKGAQDKRVQAEAEKQKILSLGDIVISMPVGPTGKLFGRVTSREVITRINEMAAGQISLPKHAVRIIDYPRGVDELGKYQASLQIASTVVVTVTLLVIKAD